jgi:hypothetical protein
VIGLDDYLSHSGRAKVLEVKWEEHDPFSVINNGRTRTKREFLDLFTAYSLDYQWLPSESSSKTLLRAAVLRPASTICAQITIGRFTIHSNGSSQASVLFGI